MSFSLSNARERPPTRAASGKRGCTLARSLDLRPDRDTPNISHEFNFFHLCSRELRAFVVVRYVYVALVPLHHASHTIPRHATPSHATLRRADSCHTRPYITNASRVCVSDVALPRFHPCVGLNARVRAVRTPARDVSSHTRVFFCNVRSQVYSTLHYQWTIPSTRVKQSTAHCFP